jgi:hypothetical protein
MSGRVASMADVPRWRGLFHRHDGLQRGLTGWFKIQEHWMTGSLCASCDSVLMMLANE